MTNARTFKTTIIASIIAIAIAIGYTAFMCPVKADAIAKKTCYGTTTQTTTVNQLPASTSKLNQFAKAYTFKASGRTSYGYDWTYKADVKNLKVSCKYDFKAHKYNFKITGKSYGLNHITIRYKTADKKWASQKMTIFVDSEKYIMRTA